MTNEPQPETLVCKAASGDLVTTVGGGGGGGPAAYHTHPCLVSGSLLWKDTGKWSTAERHGCNMDVDPPPLLPLCNIMY